MGASSANTCTSRRGGSMPILNVTQHRDDSLEEALGQVWILVISVHGLGHFKYNLLPYCQKTKLLAALANPLIFFWNAGSPKQAQMESLLAAVAYDHGFWAGLRPTSYASCVRVYCRACGL